MYSPSPFDEALSQRLLEDKPVKKSWSASKMSSWFPRRSKRGARNSSSDDYDYEDISFTANDSSRKSSLPLLVGDKNPFLDIKRNHDTDDSVKDHLAPCSSSPVENIDAGIDVETMMTLLVQEETRNIDLVILRERELELCEITSSMQQLRDIQNGKCNNLAFC